MSILTLNLVPATSAGWVDQFDSSRGVTFKRNDSGTPWQKFTLPAVVPSGWDLIGFDVSSLDGTDLTATVRNQSPALGMVCRLYQGTLAQCSAVSPQTYDQNTGTYYGDAATQSSARAITAIFDLGQTMAVGSYQVTIGAQGSTMTYLLESSTDGATWTTVTGTGATVSSVDPSTVAVSFSSVVNARWWRYSIEQNGSAPWRVRLYEFQLYTPGLSGGGG